MRRLRAFVAVGFGLCVAGMWSCAANDRSAQPDRLSGEPGAGHAVHSGQLHAIMSKLGRTSTKTWPQEIESERAADAERARAERFEEARQLAAAMSKAAGQLPAAVAQVEFEPGGRESFLAEVERLRTQADELEASAGRHDFEAMRATLQSVRATCNGCHSQFRAVAGPIKLPSSAL